MTGILLIEDHPLLRVGLQAQLAERGLQADIADLGSIDTLLGQVVAALPVLVVLDLGLPLVGGGAALVGPIVGLGASVLVLTGEIDVELWARCFEAGALGIVSKEESLCSILCSIERARVGQPVDSHQRDVVLATARARRDHERARLAVFDSLTAREQAVLAGLVDGRSATQIAARDFVSIETIRSQIKAVLRKLGVSSQLEAVALAHLAGWDPASTLGSRVR